MDYLVGDWLDGAGLEKSVELSGVEVGDSHAADQASAHQALHGLPGVQVVHLRELDLLIDGGEQLSIFLLKK